MSNELQKVFVKPVLYAIVSKCRSLGYITYSLRAVYMQCGLHVGCLTLGHDMQISALRVHRRWDNSDSGIWIGIGINTYSSLMESESELNRLLIFQLDSESKLELTLSGIGIGSDHTPTNSILFFTSTTILVSFSNMESELESKTWFYAGIGIGI